MNKRFERFLKQTSLVPLSLLVLFSVSSCGVGNGKFRMEGHFRNFNNGQLYVYSLDNSAATLDTINVSSGRFSYETEVKDKETFIILFPNYSEQVVFGESGGTAKINGDASHLKEIEITGTDDNERMTKFRQNINRLSPPETKREAAAFIKENPTSPISVYILRRYFLQSTTPDYAQAATLLATMTKAAPDNGRLSTLSKQIDKLKEAATGTKVKDFSAIATNGQSVTKQALSAKANVVNVWASWNYDSQNMQRMLDKLKKDNGSKLGLLGICLDASKKDCRRVLERDSIKWLNVCDERMWDSPLLTTFGVGTVPGNVVIDHSGKVVARNLTSQQIEEKIKELLK